jgi:WhiB family redox-sensing transcriptional regulator
VSDFRHRAACRDADPELFFPVGHAGPARRQIAAAKAVCHRCPVVEQCLAWAMNAGHEEGVWGGQDMSERRVLHLRTRDVDARRGA